MKRKSTIFIVESMPSLVPYMDRWNSNDLKITFKGFCCVTSLNVYAAIWATLVDQYNTGNHSLIFDISWKWPTKIWDKTIITSEAMLSWINCKFSQTNYLNWTINNAVNALCSIDTFWTTVSEILPKDCLKRNEMYIYTNIGVVQKMGHRLFMILVIPVFLYSHLKNVLPGLP